eukprot:jgi/Galph1/5273/GphlegSOOS_G3916.1
MLCYIEGALHTKGVHCIHQKKDCRLNRQVYSHRKGCNQARWCSPPSHGWLKTRSTEFHYNYCSGVPINFRSEFVPRTVFQETRTRREGRSLTAVVVCAEETEADTSIKMPETYPREMIEQIWSQNSLNGTPQDRQVPIPSTGTRPKLIENKKKVFGKLPVPRNVSFGYEDLDREVGDIVYSFSVGDVRKGVVVQIINGGALVDIGAKATALLPSNEVSLFPVESIHDVLHLGEEKEFLILDADSDTGHLKVSIRRLELEEAWRKLEKAVDEATTLNATVTATNRGGCLVLVEGIRGFLPISHISLPGTPLEEMVGKFLPVKCLEVDKSKGRLVVSHRRAMAEKQMQDLKTGTLIQGTVQGVKPYGVFVDVFGTSGLLHISQISHDQVTNINSLFSLGETVKCMVVSFDKQRGRISLSTKALEPHPGDMLRNKQFVYEKAEEMAVTYNERVDTQLKLKTSGSSTDDIIAGLDIGSLDDLDPILFGTNSSKTSERDESMNGNITD